MLFGSRQRQAKIKNVDWLCITHFAQCFMRVVKGEERKGLHEKEGAGRIMACLKRINRGRKKGRRPTDSAKGARLPAVAQCFEGEGLRGAKR